MALVWDTDLPPGEKLVLLALADQANDAGVQCWPSVETIARRSGQGVRTVRRALASLEEKGHLTRAHRDGTSSQYHVHPCQSGTPANLAPLPKTTITPAKLAPTPAKLAPKPSLKHQEPPKVVKRARDQFILPDWIPAEPWEGFVAMRKEIGHRLTERGIKLAIGSLDELRAKGHDPGKVLDQSTMKNWRGLFEVKENGRSDTNRQNLTAPSGRPMGRTEAAARAAAGMAGPGKPRGDHANPIALPDHRRAIGYVP